MKKSKLFIPLIFLLSLTSCGSNGEILTTQQRDERLSQIIGDQETSYEDVDEYTFSEKSYTYRLDGERTSNEYISYSVEKQYYCRSSKVKAVEYGSVFENYVANMWIYLKDGQYYVVEYASGVSYGTNIDTATYFIVPDTSNFFSILEKLSVRTLDRETMFAHNEIGYFLDISNDTDRGDYLKYSVEFYSKGEGHIFMESNLVIETNHPAYGLRSIKSADYSSVRITSNLLSSMRVKTSVESINYKNEYASKDGNDFSVNISYKASISYPNLNGYTQL